MFRWSGENIVIEAAVEELKSCKELSVNLTIRYLAHVLAASTATSRNRHCRNRRSLVSSETVFTRKQGPRAEYREKQNVRVAASPSLAKKYGKLKSLKVTAGYYAPEGLVCQRELTYDVNLNHAKAIFRIDCPTDECVEGDFDLTKELAAVITKRAKILSGELCCKGWKSKTLMQKVKCDHILRYQLKLSY